MIKIVILKLESQVYLMMLQKKMLNLILIHLQLLNQSIY